MFLNPIHKKIMFLHTTNRSNVCRGPPAELVPILITVLKALDLKPPESFHSIASSPAMETI